MVYAIECTMERAMAYGMGLSMASHAHGMRHGVPRRVIHGVVYTMGRSLGHLIGGANIVISGSKHRINHGSSRAVGSAMA